MLRIPHPDPIQVSIDGKLRASAAACAGCGRSSTPCARRARAPWRPPGATTSAPPSPLKRSTPAEWAGSQRRNGAGLALSSPPLTCAGSQIAANPGDQGSAAQRGQGEVRPDIEGHRAPPRSHWAPQPKPALYSVWAQAAVAGSTQWVTEISAERTVEAQCAYWGNGSAFAPDTRAAGLAPMPPELVVLGPGGELVPTSSPARSDGGREGGVQPGGMAGNDQGTPGPAPGDARKTAEVESGVASAGVALPRHHDCRWPAVLAQASPTAAGGSRPPQQDCPA